MTEVPDEVAGGSTGQAKQPSAGRDGGGPTKGALSPRDLALLALVAEGHGNAAIAARLELSVQSVKNDLTAILRALAAPNRTAAVVLALQQGMLDVRRLRVERRPPLPADDPEG